MKKLLKTIGNILAFPFKMLAIGLIYFYKKVISPLLPHVCRFEPTCSTYTLESIKRFGLIKGGALGARRILRCNPWNKGPKNDPVPDNIKGDIKWIL